MLTEQDQPTLSEVLRGWKIVRTGSAQAGDKYWRPADRVWLPVGYQKFGIGVRSADMPIIIRKER